MSDEINEADDSVNEADAAGDASDAGDADDVTDADLEEERAKLPELKQKESDAVKLELPPLHVFEAALFLANRPAEYAELSKITGFPKELCKTMARELKNEYAARDNAVEVVAGDEVAALQLKGEYLDRVARASKEINLTRKGTRILALIAKKKELLQKDLKHYFRGEIYAYVTELRQAGYIEAERRGQTRLLRPTQKFFETFQMVSPPSSSSASSSSASSSPASSSPSASSSSSSSSSQQ